MSSMPVEWHEQCWQNRRETHRRLVDQLNELAERVQRSAQENAVYRKQIDRAKKLGKKSFDDERFRAE